LVAITLRLRIEQLPARHGDNARHDVALLQRLSGGHDQRNLRTCTNQNDVRSAVRGIGQDVCTLAQPIRRGTLAAIERWHVLTRQNQRDRAITHFQRDPPGDSRLIGIARTDDRETWNRAQAGELLDRLMGRSVLPQRDAVVGENIDHV
jgi:hypothetical protein